MRFATVLRAAVLASGSLIAASAHADGFTWEKIDGAKTATITVDNDTPRAFRYQSTGFLWNNNTLNPVTDAVGSVYLKLNQALYTAVANAAQNVPEYRGHYVSVDGPISLSVQPNGGSYAHLVSFTGPSAKVTMDLAGNRAGVSVSCRVVVTSGVITATGGRLDLASGALTGLTVSAPTPTHSESCSTSLGWIPIIGTLIDKFATSTASNYLDGMIQSLVPANVELAPLHFMGLDTALAQVSWPTGPLADAAGFVKDNLWNAFQSSGVSIWIGQAPNPGAYVNADRLRFSFSSMGHSISLTINEYAAYRMKQSPCTPACIPT